MSKAGVDTIQRSYDDVPYASYPFPQSAPEHLQAIAWLFGLQAPEPATARVLELGCAAGGNLVPFAVRHPRAEALGLDLSEVQIRDGQAVITAMGLDNLELRQCDVSQVDADALGKFDYIICHGVYSWVPPHVQDAILRLCGNLLTDSGIAYVSYNTYPGWKTKEVLRDAMLLRGAPRTTPAEKLSYARGMIDFLTEMAPKDSLLAGIMESNAQTLRQSQDSYLLHEFLETYNQPCYFREFLERAGTHGLAYLAEAELSRMFITNYRPDAVEPLLRECGGSQILLEQYLDFLTQRQFRQTLLVHTSQAGSIRYNLQPERLQAMHFAANLPCLDGDARLDANPQRFGPSEAAHLVLRSGYAKAVALALTEAWPATLDSAGMHTAAMQRLGPSAPAPHPDAIAEILEALVIHGMAQYRTQPVTAASTVPATPVVDGSIRARASSALPEQVKGHVFNTWHETVGVSPAEQILLPLLDGSNDRTALIQALTAAATDGRITFFRDGTRITGDDAIADHATRHVDDFLKRLRSMKIVSPA